MRKRTAVITVIIAVLAALILWSVFVQIYVDGLWFNAVGYLSVFTTRIWTQVVLWICGFVLTAAVLGLNFYLAARLSPLRFVREIPAEASIEIPVARLAQIGRWVATVLVPVIATVMAKSAADQWFTFLRFYHRVPFESVDPIFGRDVGFYVFVLPIIVFLRQYLMILIVLSAIGALAVYFAKGSLATAHYRISSRAARHIGILTALFFALVAVGYWLDRYELLFSGHGVVFGAGYSDVYARIPACWVMLLVSLTTAVMFLISGWRRSARLTVAAPVVFVAAQVLMWIFPALVQTLMVTPNEFARERPYIENNIAATRKAYGLDKVEVKKFGAVGKLDLKTIEGEGPTTRNIRLWDWRPLQATYNQIQGLRLYYQFNDVDADRYRIQGDYQAVVLSPRELNQNKVKEEARTWVGLHLMYTHGYGLCMSPVNEVTEEGNPNLIIRDIPPVAERGTEITQPAIYFGELSTNYIFVKTEQPEFDYPEGGENKYTTYQGKAGVPVSGLLRRLAFAWYLGDKNILFTDQFTDESRIIFRRHIRERVQVIAPFLQYDRDAYPVLVNGRVLWILDAYTTTSKYPYSTYTYGGPGERPTWINYIRNAVKVAIDAYDGTVTFYVADPQDPIIRTMQGIFPDMFVSMAAEMPEELRSHIRYPLDLFDIQAHQYGTYHMTDPQVFYNKEDEWVRPRETYGSSGSEVDVESYYIIMRLPGAEEPEFLLMLPFVPATKDNLIGWMAGRCDGDEYGKLIVYEFPKKKLLYGPRQVEARIDQDAEISKELTLWGARGGGSAVTRGNLLVIPIQDSIIYVEPLYIQAEKGEIPQLKRVIAAYEDRIVMTDTLAGALAEVFGEKAPPAVVKKPEGPPITEKPLPQAKDALQRLRNAMERLKELEKQLEALRKDLEALAEPKPQD